MTNTRCKHLCKLSVNWSWNKIEGHRVNSIKLKLTSLPFDLVLSLMLCYSNSFFIKVQLNNTVKPVYNGQPCGITILAFVDRWPLFGNIYTQLIFFCICCSLCLNCWTHDTTGKNTIVQHTTWPANIPLSNTRHDGQICHCPTHESRLQVQHKHNPWYSMLTFTSPKSLFLRLKTAM